MKLRKIRQPYIRITRNDAGIIVNKAITCIMERAIDFLQQEMSTQLLRIRYLDIKFRLLLGAKSLLYETGTTNCVKFACILG